MSSVAKILFSRIFGGKNELWEKKLYEISRYLRILVGSLAIIFSQSLWLRNFSRVNPYRPFQTAFQPERDPNQQQIIKSQK